MDLAVRKAQKGETPEWEEHPERFVHDDDGNLVWLKDGSRPKRIPGKRGRTLSKESEAKNRARKSITRRKKNLKKLEKKLDNQRQNLRKAEKVVKTLDGDLGKKKEDKKPAVVSETDLDALPPSVKDHLLDNESNVAFKPNPGPQTDFLASSETDVLYGGAAGGGKSYALLADPLRYVHRAEHKALILRKTLPELTELIDKSRKMYKEAFPGADYKETKKTWKFPSGATIQFGYCERDADVYQYQGQQYSWIGFDELTHLPTSFAWDYLRSRLRTTDPEITCYMRATTNPGGVGHAWVKKRYIDPAPANTTIWEKYYDEEGIEHKLSRRFIPAKLADNPYLAQGGQYKGMLLSMDPIQRKRLLEGDWDIIEGAAFPEFNKELHVIQPFDIPVHWERFKCIDYGYRAPSAVLWIAIDPSDGTLIVYKELYEKGLVGEKLAERMHDMELDEVMPIPGVLDGAAWSDHGKGKEGPTVGESLLRMGHKLRRADKQRVAGKIQVHERLKVNEKTNRPRTQFFDKCPNIIRELSSIPVDPNNREDVDTKAEDHAYDAFRYGVMSRPRLDDPFMRMQRFKTDVYRPVDEVFGY